MALAEMVREAVDSYIAEHKLSVAERVLQAGGLWQDRDDLDAAIAASSKVADTLLYTLNIKHYPMTDIETIKPYKKSVMLTALRRGLLCSPVCRDTLGSTFIVGSVELG